MAILDCLTGVDYSQVRPKYICLKATGSVDGCVQQAIMICASERCDVKFDYNGEEIWVVYSSLVAPIYDQFER